MTIGLILLAIVAILIFFGVTERFFRALGVGNWLAFLLVLALIVGAVVPAFTIGGFSFNLGGFVVPLVILTVLMAVMIGAAERVRTVLGIMAVAATAIATRMLIEPGSGGLILASSLIAGFAGGVVAFLVGQTRLSMLASALGGIILGDIIVNFLYTFVLGGYSFTLGSYGVFDSMIIAGVFGILVFEAVGMIKRANSKKAEGSGKTGRAGLAGLAGAAGAESGEDQHFDEIRLHTGDSDTEKELNPSPETKELSPADPMKTDGFFDDFI